MSSKRTTIFLMALAILLLNIGLNGPLFAPGDLPYPGSIERGYVGTARFLSQHPNPWGWDPYVYCGLPTQFLYVPLLPYVSALGMRLLPAISPDMVYRTIVSLITCLGPVTLFLFALYFTGSKWWAFGIAISYSLLSPSYMLFPAVEKDRGIVQLPWRIQVLAKYGEGPHNTGLMLLPLALLALWKAAKSRAFSPIFIAALLLAAIPLNNWVAAFALAISCSLLLLAAAGEPGFGFVRAFAAAVLAYLLAAFWLTPTFIKTIVFNWPVDSFDYKLQHTQTLLLAGGIAGVLVIRLLFWWRGGSLYLCFVVMGAFVFGWISTAFYVYGVDVIPESRRYAIEFELFVALAAGEALRLAMRSSNGTVRLCAIGSGGVFLLLGAPQLWTYLTQGWKPWMPSPPAQTVEYQLAEWLAQHPPQGRIFASGGLRFRINSWFDLAQIGGGFETGLQNRVPVDLAYRIRAVSGTDETVQELKALGANYLIIHGPKSREYYRDFVKPERISSILPAVFHLEDDTVYALPNLPLAHLIRPDELPDRKSLARYVAAIEDRSRPALGVQWQNADHMVITGVIRQDDIVSVQVNASPGWTVNQDGRPLSIIPDDLGFITLRPDASAGTRIELSYRGTAEQRIMAAISALAWIAALLALWRTKGTPWQTPSDLTTTS